MHPLRFRQVHLDFHTSPAIPGIGESFDPDEWQRTLKNAAVDSITIFAKCHHGWSYHPTGVGKMHPHLGFDLTRAQFDACKQVDINAPIYLSAGVDNVASHDHPEWREVLWNGQYSGWSREVTSAGFHKLCFNSPYLDYLCAQIREAVRLFPKADGVFLDIVSQNPCCCRWCLETMEEKNLDATCEEDRLACARLSLDRYYRECTAACRCDQPDMAVFHNSGHVARGDRTLLKYVSHLELESLPTGGWGYDHFPLSAKYASGLGVDFLGMTGKFHSTWGEFGGYKHPNALRYECAAMLAFGSKCSVGDQLAPDGRLDASTYKNIGAAYREVAAKESWCRGVRNVADVGLLSSEAVNRGSRDGDHADVGAARMLLEEHALFDVLDTEMDFTSYRALLLPDNVAVAPALKRKLDEYLAAGGKLLLTGASGLDPESGKSLFDLGAEVGAESEFSPDFIVPVPELQPDFVASPLVMYARSRRLRVTHGKSLGAIHDPYFNRTFRHFCSHQHAPARPEPSGYDCGVLNATGNILYLAHPVFTIYRAFGAVACRHYCAKALALLLDGPSRLVCNLPSTGRVSLMRQETERRSVLHLLNANPINRGGATSLSGGTLTGSVRSFEVIEDLTPLHGVRIRVNPGHPVVRVTVEPEGRELKFERDGGEILVTLDGFTCHAMLVLHETV